MLELEHILILVILSRGLTLLDQPSLVNLDWNYFPDGGSRNDCFEGGQETKMFE
jgi:hypothetical protein